jgi:hypothetical protein
MRHTVEELGVKENEKQTPNIEEAHARRRQQQHNLTPTRTVASLCREGLWYSMRTDSKLIHLPMGKCSYWYGSESYADWYSKW